MLSKGILKICVRDSDSKEIIPVRAAVSVQAALIIRGACYDYGQKPGEQFFGKGARFFKKTGREMAEDAKKICFWTDGRFEIQGDKGDVDISLWRGLEYIPLQKTVRVERGVKTVDIYLERWMNLRKKGWYCGENHFHLRYGGKPDWNINLFPLASLISRASGLDYVNVGPGWINADFNGRQESIALLKKHCLQNSKKDFILSWAMEKPKDMVRPLLKKPPFGHCWSINIEDYRMRGECNDLEKPEGWGDATRRPLFWFHKMFHKQGGISVYAHPVSRWKSAPGDKFALKGRISSNMAAELPFDTIAGPTYDGLDILYGADNQGLLLLAERTWYLLLNMGYKIAGTAGSDYPTAMPGKFPGYFRLYSYLGNKKFSIPSIAKAIKEGRNFVTTGPFVFFSVNGKFPGDSIRAAGRTLTAKIEAYAPSSAKSCLVKMEVVRNGKIIKSIDLRGKKLRKYEQEFSIKESKYCWYIVKCYAGTPERWFSGVGFRMLQMPSRSVAITNPIYFIPPGYHRPKPHQAVVTGEISDAATGKPINAAEGEIIDCGRTISRFKIKGGKFKIIVPATSDIKITAEGYKTACKNIFLDHGPFQDIVDEATYGKHAPADAGLYERIKEELMRIKLGFTLRRAGGTGRNVV